MSAGARRQLPLPSQRVRDDGRSSNCGCHLSLERARSHATMICASAGGLDIEVDAGTRFMVSIISSTEKFRRRAPPPSSIGVFQDNPSRLNLKVAEAVSTTVLRFKYQQGRLILCGSFYLKHRAFHKNR
jgi:hypothetical protein